MTDIISIGTKVTLLQTEYRDINGHYTKVEIPVEYEVVDIFLENYIRIQSYCQSKILCTRL